MIPALLPSLLLAVQVTPSPAASPPPPPPPNYDPQPGPRFVAVDDAGAVGPDQRELLRYALEGWEGPSFSAFFLCYRARDGIDPAHAASDAAIENVARLLKEGGASVVVSAANQTCNGPVRPRYRDQAWVEVMGVVRR